MRALPVVLLLAATAPALADTAPAPLPILPPALTAPAAPPAAEELPEPPPSKHGYRWQIAAADAATIALSIGVDRLATDGGGRPGALATITIASYFFSAPLIHGLHRQGTRALGSFALRTGLPLVLGLIGEQLDGTPKCDFCVDASRSEGRLIGLTAGVLIAMAVDSGLLARPIYQPTERPRAAWAPALRGVRGGATAGVLGTF